MALAAAATAGAATAAATASSDLAAAQTAVLVWHLAITALAGLEHIVVLSPVVGQRRSQNVIDYSAFRFNFSALKVDIPAYFAIHSAENPLIGRKI